MYFVIVSAENVVFQVFLHSSSTFIWHDKKFEGTHILDNCSDPYIYFSSHNMFRRSGLGHMLMHTATPLHWKIEKACLSHEDDKKTYTDGMQCVHFTKSNWPRRDQLDLNYASMVIWRMVKIYKDKDKEPITKQYWVKCTEGRTK